MVIYEITASVEAELRIEFEDYMKNCHISDLLVTGHFVSAYLTKNQASYRILYFARSAKTLDDYLEFEAPRLRAEMLERFPVGIEFSRENWEVVAKFEP